MEQRPRCLGLAQVVEPDVGGPCFTEEEPKSHLRVNRVGILPVAILGSLLTNVAGFTRTSVPVRATPVRVPCLRSGRGW